MNCRSLSITLAALAISACGPSPDDLNDYAQEYLYLELSMGLHDGGHVDAYFGPEELQTAAETTALSLDQILKAFYYEAAAAQPGSASPTAEELDDWFWGETAAAKVLFAVKDRCLKKDDKMMQLLGKILLIPMSQSNRFGPNFPTN